jgi:hypothetical protein
VIPNGHCGAAGGDRFVTAPIQANPDGSPINLPTIHTTADIQKEAIEGATVSGFADIVVKENLTYEEYIRAIQLLKEIEQGTHHIDGQGILETQGQFTTAQMTYKMEMTNVDQDGGPSRPLLVDIETALRVAPMGPDGKLLPIPDTKSGFVPLGGDSPTGKATDPLPVGKNPDGTFKFDSTLFNDLADKSTNKQAIASQDNFSAPRDMINKYTTVDPATGKVVNGDRAAVSNDLVIFSSGSATTAKDSPILPRTTTTNPFPK